jgi:hypothetical protein
MSSVLKEKSRKLFPTKEKGFDAGKKDNVSNDFSDLEKSVLFTLAFYNCRDLALTELELWENLMRLGGVGRVSFEELIELLEKSPLRDIVRKKWGFLTLPGEENLARERIRSQKISLKKIKKARRLIQALLVIPYFRGAFLTGTLSLGSAQKNSDWDIMIILEKDRIWLGRFLVSSCLQLLGKRRHGEKVKDRFCLNHFLTTRGLHFEDQSKYSASEVAFSLPLLGINAHRRFLQENRDWVREVKPNFQVRSWESDFLAVRPPIGVRFFQGSVETFLDFTGLGGLLNIFFKDVMLRKIKNNPKTYKKDADIRCNDQALVFLPSPRRGKVYQRALEKLRKLGYNVA